MNKLFAILLLAAVIAVASAQYYAAYAPTAYSSAYVNRAYGLGYGVGVPYSSYGHAGLAYPGLAYYKK